MKKFLIIFAILDLIFVGVILNINSQKERSIASSESGKRLTAGQNQKLELIQSFQFSSSLNDVALTTDYLQSLCTLYDNIELKFKAINIAFSGQQPFISHSFSCSEIKKEADLDSLRTSIADIKSLQKKPVLKKDSGELRAVGIYSDEELPKEWLLYEIVVSGEISFTISEAELNKALGLENFKFKLTTF